MEEKSTALITGGAKRMGRVLATSLARAGYDIALHFHTSNAEASAVASEIEALGRRCTLFQANLADLSQAERLMPQVMEACPSCRVVIHNASLFERMSLQETSAESYQRNLNLHLGAPLLMTRDFARLLPEEARGDVITILDSAITDHKSAYFPYLLSKKALAAFTRMAARELSPRVRLNGICPGVTPMEGSHPEDVEFGLRTTLTGALGTPQDIAEAVLFLLGNPAVLGQWLFVDNGLHLRT